MDQIAKLGHESRHIIKRWRLIQLTKSFFRVKDLDRYVVVIHVNNVGLG